MPALPTFKMVVTVSFESPPVTVSEPSPPVWVPTYARLVVTWPPSRMKSEPVPGLSDDELMRGNQVEPLPETVTVPVEPASKPR